MFPAREYHKKSILAHLPFLARPIHPPPAMSEQDKDTRDDAPATTNNAEPDTNAESDQRTFASLTPAARAHPLSLSLSPAAPAQEGAPNNNDDQPAKRSRGRPKGSKNKPREGAASAPVPDAGKRKRGRPPKVRAPCLPRPAEECSSTPRRSMQTPLARAATTRPISLQKGPAEDPQRNRCCPRPETTQTATLPLLLAPAQPRSVADLPSRPSHPSLPYPPPSSRSPSPRPSFSSSLSQSLTSLFHRL